MALVDVGANITLDIDVQGNNANRLEGELGGSSASLFDVTNNGEVFWHWSTHLPTEICGFRWGAWDDGELSANYLTYPTQTDHFTKLNVTGGNPFSTYGIRPMRMFVGNPTDSEDNGWIKVQQAGGAWPRFYTNANWVSDWDDSFVRMHSRVGTGFVHQTEEFTNPTEVSTQIQFSKGTDVSDAGNFENQNGALFIYRTGDALSGYEFGGSRRRLTQNFSDIIEPGETIYLTVVGIDGDFSTGDTNYFHTNASWTWSTGARDEELLEQPVHTRSVAMRHHRLTNTHKIKMRGRIR